MLVVDVVMVDRPRCIRISSTVHNVGDIRTSGRPVGTLLVSQTIINLLILLESEKGSDVSSFDNLMVGKESWQIMNEISLTTPCSYLKVHLL